ncbi:Putative metal-binding motif-containing protein [Tenacibaculum sp. MAR_2009_124]|uniref:putative metal-binding motif-containing protein n=1 Tax=Tenacibaculum sp. MAR_2009_124 TaxID=1250059 RepID=UPI00089843CE|nr:putative metal-binding motif-containing protein [Tenacibaculum sp. MAR_2009_124]SED17039.1 Putative metal-binding motif-containing protein [Tenacibaculum sp. MAR_2009_124]
MKNSIIKIILPVTLLITAILIVGPGCTQDNIPWWYKDADGDGFGIYEDRQQASSQPSGYVDNTDDCDDTNANVFPNATEIPDNEIDEDCNGKFAYTFYSDKDGDGFGSPSPIVVEIDNHTTAPNNHSWFAGDCDDNDIAIHPKANEIPNNGIDDNCDGETDVIEYYIDADGDGYGSQQFSAAQGVHNKLDCNDTNNEIHPYTREIPNDGIDSNCDGNDNT